MKKIKLIASILTICLAVTTLAYGVFAAASLSFNISANVAFEVSNLFIELKVEVTGAYDSNGNAINDLSYTYNWGEAFNSSLVVDNTALSNWVTTEIGNDLQDLRFNTNTITPIQMKVTVKNRTPNKDLVVTIAEQTPTSSTYVTITNVSSDPITAYDGNTIDSDFATITYTPKALSSSFNFNPTWIIGINEYTTPLYSLDANGYYAEMGTYNSQPVKWRLVGTFNEATNSMTQYTYSAGNPAPTGTGMFLLETLIIDDWNKKIFNEVNQNVYDDVNCIVRNYLIGSGTNDFINKLNINTNSGVYSQIIERNLSYSYRNDYSSVTATSHTTTSADKLWTLSFFDGCQIFNNVDSWWMNSDQYARADWDLISTTDDYWLSCPGTIFDDIYYMDCVFHDGNHIQGNISNYGTTNVRPAFLLGL